MLKNQILITSLYRFLITLIVAYDIWSSASELNQMVMFRMAAVIVFAIIFSSLWRSKTISYIEWFVVLLSIYLYSEHLIINMLLIIPIIQLSMYRIKTYEMLIIPLSLAIVYSITGIDLSLTVVLSSSVCLSILYLNSNLNKISKLDKIVMKIKKENEKLRKEDSRKENQLNITSKLFYYKNLLEDVNSVNDLINGIINATQGLFNSDYVAFYYFKNGVYVYLGGPKNKSIEDLDIEIPTKYTRNEGNKFSYDKDTLEMPIFYEGQPWGRILVYKKKSLVSERKMDFELSFGDQDFETMTMLLETAMFRLKEIRSRRQLELAAHYDRLTKIPNRAHLEKNAFVKKQKDYEKKQIPFHVMMLDIDDFKSFNDTFGHDVGDTVLKIVSSVMTKTVKENGTDEMDIIGRWGGEEFLGFFTGSIDEAYELAEKVRINIENFKFPQRSITVSIGIASYSSADGELLKTTKKADIALYHSKNQGKNITTIYEEGMEE